MLSALAVAVTGTVLGLVLGLGGTSGGTSNDAAAAGPGSSQFSDRGYVCQIEANAILDVSYNDISANTNSGLYGAVGASSPVLAVVNGQLLSVFFGDVNRVGVTDAETQIIPNIQAACQQAGDPVLTSGQLQSLSSIAPSADASLLGQVRIFQ